MSWKEQQGLDPEVLREVASVGGYYGKKIEYYASRKRRVEKALIYLRGRLFKYSCPVFSIRQIVRLRKELKATQKELEKYVYYMIVYREAIGLTNHKSMYKVYNLSND